MYVIEIREWYKHKNPAFVFCCDSWPERATKGDGNKFPQSQCVCMYLCLCMKKSEKNQRSRAKSRIRWFEGAHGKRIDRYTIFMCFNQIEFVLWRVPKCWALLFSKSTTLSRIVVSMAQFFSYVFSFSILIVLYLPPPHLSLSFLLVHMLTLYRILPCLFVDRELLQLNKQYFIPPCNNKQIHKKKIRIRRRRG